MGLADCFDALLSKRHYKEPVPIQQTMTMILNGECGAFSPKLLECFKASTQELQELVRNQTGDRLNMAANQDFPTAQLYETERDRGVLMDTLEIAQGKYLALMHYIDACILEIAFDDQHFHLQYNPYPELAELGNLRSIADLNRYMVEVMAAPEDQERMRHFMEQGIEGFLNSGMRRKSQRFKLINNNDDAESFDLTLLRVNVHQKEHRTFAILFKKLKSEKHSSASYHEDMLAQSTYCCYNDRYLTLVDLGGAMDSLMGYTKQEILRRFQGRLMDMIHPDDRMLLHEAVNNQLYKYKVAQLEYRMIHKDGSVHWVMDRSKCSTGTDGSEYIYTYLTDITQTKESIREDRDKLKHYEMILSRTDNVLFSWDYENGEISYSDVQDTLFSRIGVAENIDKLYSGETAIHPDDRPLMVDKIMKIVQGSDFEMAEIRIANGNGTYMWHRLRGNAIRDPEGRLRQIVGIIINIDDEKKRTLTLMDEASRDPLTGLLNKAAAKKQAEDYFSQYQSLDIQSAVLVIDLDNFKLANDRFGHLYGDALLTQVAGELKKLFRNQDIVARIGGDEFLVVMRGIADRALVENRCRQVLSSLQQLFEKSSKNLPLSCSIGVAVSAEHGNTYNELFQKADMALYDAKSQGKNTYLFYDPRNSGFYGGAPGRTTPHTAIESDIHPDLSHTNIVKHLFRILYSAQDVGYAVSSVLAIVGEISQVSRVYVFENSADGAYCSNTYEWCKEGILPQKDALQQVYYDRDIPGYREAYDENGILYCSDILELPKAVYNIVKPQGIKSMLHCAMMPGGKFRGYIGFDDCEKTRLWTKEEIELLRYFSEVLSVFLHQEYEKKQLLAQLKKAAPTEAHS